MKLSKFLIGCSIISAGVLAIGAGLLDLKQAEAQSIPACRNIQPRPDQVCYTEHPFSARQRDEGGTKSWSFIVERVAPNYVIIDYQILVDRSFGAASKPTGSVVSATGNASIIQTTTREEEKLGQTKSQLKGKLQGCFPPVCGQLQGQIERIDREITKLSDTRRTAISAGGNEKITFTHTTSVRCRRWLGVPECGSGAAIDGKVRVNHRYLGDPNSLRQASTSLVQQSLSLLQQPSTSSSPKQCPSSYSKQGFGGRTGQIAFFNEWNTPVTVVLYHPSNGQIFDRYTVSPKQNNFLGNNVVIGDDWGVCFENKPSASGVVNNAGAISEHNPNWQGKTLFMIQNPRIR